MTMDITLKKASIADAKEIFDMQIKSFKKLLEKYKDYDYNPGAESIDRTIKRFEEPVSDYYFITLNGINIGAVRVCNYQKICKLKQIFILPEYQNKGYSQEAIKILESLYQEASKWELDTILEEDKLCHLYEKMGYRKTGKIKYLKEGMNLVFYEKKHNIK